MTTKSPGNGRGRNSGQTMGEFSIILPILLLLVFGIVEFGRLFQSWVTLQNSARVAARFAVTGQYNEEKYRDLDELLPCFTESQNAAATDNVNGTEYSVATRSIPYYTESGINTYSINVYEPNGGVSPDYDESLFMSHYGVGDCYPSDETDQMRKDMLRLASIYDEARRGAAGLYIEEYATGNGTKADFDEYIRSLWSNPSPRVDSPAYFEVVVCSARQRLYGNDQTLIVNNPDDELSMAGRTEEASTRFYLYQPSGDDPAPVLEQDDGSSIHSPDFPAGVCVVKEQPRSDLDPAEFPVPPLDIYDRPTGDPGDAGERIIITVTYNHPLVTPLGLARYIQLQARRAAINESFKVTNADRALGGPGALAPEPPTLPPPTETPIPSDTPTDAPTETPTETATSTVTSSPEPFTCDNVTGEFLYFDGHSALIELRNANFEPTYLERAVVWWNPEALEVTQPNAYVAHESLEGSLYWLGDEDATSVQTRPYPAIVDSTDPAQGTDFADERAEQVIGTDDSILWKVTWGGIQGISLGEYMSGNDLDGTTVYMHNPINPGSPCPVTVSVPPPPPTATPVTPGQEPTVTETPDCADLRVSIEFVRFDSFGDVRLRVTNNRPFESTFFGFQLNWPDQAAIKFRRMVVGGANANDVNDPVNNPNGTGIVVWENTSGGHDSSPTNSSNGSHGSWLTDYTFPANSVTDVHLDFTGVVGTLDSRGVDASMFNGSYFDIYCYRPTSGGNGGGGNSPSGNITFSEVPPPGPTSPPRPTNTLGPTLTPSQTFTPGPPTATYTPRPTRPSPTPTNTPAATATPPPSATPTDIFSCGGDGC